MQKELSRRLVVLDFYRFLAASAVVIYHVALPDLNGRLFAIVGRFSLFVDFFFILSGFVIARCYAGSVSSRADIATFLRRRFARLYPLHLLMLTVFVTVAALALAAHHPMNQEKYSLALIPEQMLLTQSWSPSPVLQMNFPAWSISVEFAMYLLFPLLILCHREIGRLGLVVIVIIGFVAMEVLSREGFIPAWDYNYSPLRALPTFTIGIIIALEMRTLVPAVPVRIAPIVLALGACSLLASTGLMVLHASNYVIIALFGIAIVLTALGELSSNRPIFDRPVVRMLGDTSYGIYMIHGFIVVVFLSAVWPRISNAPASIGCALAILLLVIGLATPIFYLFERPARDWLSGRRKRVQVSDASLLAVAKSGSSQTH
jgi:peptidoglycan/LPS O-acetylase OafA/YrhL